jgi:leucyl aminopeptidase (aminopeptidase T)
MSDLERAVETVIGSCLGIRAGEQVLVIADAGTKTIGDALRDAAETAGAEAVLTTMAERDVNGEEPPPAVAAALSASEVFIAPTSKSLSHTQARKTATEAGARGATLPGVTEDMLARLMACDFDVLQARSRKLAELLTDADQAHFTCPHGSDLTLNLVGRAGIADDGDLSGAQAFGNLPCGEGFISPSGGEGTLVVSTIAGIGLVQPEPATLTVVGGRLYDATTAEGEKLLTSLTSAGAQGTNLAELGIGTNERATLTGNVLEDEKILGTVHVAFGASMGIGGIVSVPIHLDCVVVDPTLTIGGTTVIEQGEFVLE